LSSRRARHACSNVKDGWLLAIHVCKRFMKKKRRKGEGNLPVFKCIHMCECCTGHGSFRGVNWPCLLLSMETVSRASGHWLLHACWPPCIAVFSYEYLSISCECVRGVCVCVCVWCVCVRMCVCVRLVALPIEKGQGCSRLGAFFLRYICSVHHWGEMVVFFHSSVA